MSRLLLTISKVPPVLRESLRCVLKAHKLELPEEILFEAGNNLAMALYSIDEAYGSDCDKCDGLGALFDGDGNEQPCACVPAEHH